MHQDLFGFYAQKKIVDYVKVKALHWQWKGTDLTGTKVDLGKC